MAERFATELLARLVTAHLPADPNRLAFEPIRTGKHNTSYYVRTPGAEWVLRISPPDDAGFLFYERRMMAQEPQLHGLLRAETTVPVAEILAYDDSRSLLDRDYLLNVYRPHFDRPVPASLLHMDVWSQNILVDGAGRVTGLVDLDRALWGDPEIEYAVLDYTGISEPAFWRGYGRPRDTSFSAQVRARFYLLYEVQKYIVIRIWRRNDPGQALQYKRQSFSLARPLLQALG
jgi:aminoglycoside phosphotransferase (APT) family kinase protein